MLNCSTLVVYFSLSLFKYLTLTDSLVNLPRVGDIEPNTVYFAK